MLDDVMPLVRGPRGYSPPNAGGAGNGPASARLRQEYNCPKYAVSRPAIKTAAHTRAVAATTLTPHEETAPAARQEAASRFRVLWKYQVTTTPRTTSENFQRNIPSERYFAGLDDHSVNPLKTWI